MVAAITPTELSAWLEWASARLLATPSERIKPRDSGVLWPEYSQERFEITDFRAGITLRALAPSSAEIPIMDEILLLPNLCSDPLKRKIIRLRSLVDPLRNRRLYTWTDLAGRLEIRQISAKNLYRRGLDEIAAKADPSRVRVIDLFMQENVM